MASEVTSMAGKKGPRGKNSGAGAKMSFIEEHRRRQLIDTAIGIIAGTGYGRASLENIAKAAGVSKGVISYYFKSKDELVVQIVKTLMSDMGDYVRKRLEAPVTAMERLRAYAGGFFEFALDNRDKYAAFIELWTTISAHEESNPFGSLSYEQCRASVGRILVEGQKRGEFPDMDTRTAATVIQAMIDGVIIQWLLDPEIVDIRRCRDMVLDHIELFVRGASHEKPRLKARRAAL